MPKTNCCLLIGNQPDASVRQKLFLHNSIVIHLAVLCKDRTAPFLTFNNWIWLCKERGLVAAETDTGGLAAISGFPTKSVALGKSVGACAFFWYIYINKTQTAFIMPVPARDFHNCVVSSRLGTDCHDPSQNPSHPAKEVELHQKRGEKTCELCWTVNQWYLEHLALS